MHQFTSLRSTRRNLQRIGIIGLIGLVLILLVDVVSMRGYERRLSLRAAAPTYTVCHAEEKEGNREKYYCSNEGCYSDDMYEATVVGSYEDGNVCVGIAKSLQEGGSR
jgi:hypothetical protein